MTLDDIHQVWLNYYQPIKAAWKRMLIFAILGILIMLEPYYSAKKQYTATAILHSVKTQNQGGFNSIAASFFGGDPNAANTEMGGILKSKNLGKRVALDSVEHEGRRLSLAETLHDYNNKNTSFSIKGLFRKTNKKKQLNLNKIITQQAGFLRKKLKVRTEEHGFLEISFTHTSPQLVGLISQTYITQLELYYHHQKTEKAQKDLDYFTQQSLKAKRRLDSAQIALAYVYDRQKFNIYKKGELTIERMRSETGLLQSLYSQWKRAQEDARSQLQSETPVIQVLDAPLPPYKVSGPSLKKQVLVGFFFGAFLAAFWVVRKVLWDDIKFLINRSLQAED